jgi:hypothetical protein
VTGRAVVVNQDSGRTCLHCALNRATVLLDELMATVDDGWIDLDRLDDLAAVLTDGLRDGP